MRNNTLRRRKPEKALAHGYRGVISELQVCKYMPAPLNIRCEIIGSDHSDVQIGTKGFIRQSLDKGYSVEIRGNFSQADVPNKREKETREVWFRVDQVRILPQ